MRTHIIVAVVTAIGLSASTINAEENKPKCDAWARTKVVLENKDLTILENERVCVLRVVPGASDPKKGNLLEVAHAVAFLASPTPFSMSDTNAFYYSSELKSEWKHSGMKKAWMIEMYDTLYEPIFSSFELAERYISQRLTALYKIREVTILESEQEVDETEI